jgi:hypothetical protein
MENIFSNYPVFTGFGDANFMGLKIKLANFLGGLML